MADALFIEKERAAMSLNSIGDAVVCTDVGGKITSLNLAADKMTGWTWLDAAGQPISEVLRLLDVTSREVIASPMCSAMAQSPAANFADALHSRASGRVRGSHREFRHSHSRPRRQATGAVFVFRDMSAAAGAGAANNTFSRA